MCLIISAIQLVLFIFIDYFTAQVLKVCKTPGPTACSRTKLTKVWLLRNHFVCCFQSYFALIVPVIYVVCICVVLCEIVGSGQPAHQLPLNFSIISDYKTNHTKTYTITS